MEKLPPKPKSIKGASKEELFNMNKDELVEKIIQLQAHNFQLKNIINKITTDPEKIDNFANNKKFDFSKCHVRRVLLRICYFGWDYQGLAVQENSSQTIEHHLFYALTRSCLIDSRETSMYHRCGRTDKGVSAFGQVISISLRSRHPPESQDLPSSLSSEILYCKILNRLLPKEIRAIAWMPISKDNPEYSARFDCKRRLYKYYFPRSTLDIKAMTDACAHIIGSHDFRHLCKMDVGNGVTEFTRRILRADIEPVDEKDMEQPTSMYALVIEGNAFLWHQIRCIMGVLLLVGQGNEAPAVMKDLLDIERNPRKPQYNMALDTPLNLFKCTYDVDDDGWVYDAEELKIVIGHLQSEWTVNSVKATMYKDCIRSLEETYKKINSVSETENVDNVKERDDIKVYSECLLQGVKPKVYTPLLKRDTCSTLEERIEYYRKKRKTNDSDNMDDI